MENLGILKWSNWSRMCKVAALGVLGGAAGTIGLRFVLKALDDSAATTPHAIPTFSELLWLFIIFPANALVTLAVGNASRDLFGWTITSLATLINAGLAASVVSFFCRPKRGGKKTASGYKNPPPSKGPDVESI